MYHKANIKFEIRRFSMPRALAEVSAGRADALIAHPKGSEKMINGIEPVGDELINLKFVVFSTLKEKVPLDQYKIVVARGIPFMEKTLEEMGLKFTTHPEVETIAKLLRIGRYNAVIMNQENEEWGSKKVPGLKPVSDVLVQFTFVHFVHSKRTDLIKKLKASLQ
jgi:hypothetical protein